MPGRPSRVLILVALLTALPAPSRSVAATTFGSALNRPATVQLCEPTATARYASCGVEQTRLPVGSVPSGGAVAPSGGVITRWRYRGGEPRVGYEGTSALRLRVIGADGVAHPASSASVTIATGSGQTWTFPTRLPVQQGDRLALRIDFLAGPPAFPEIYDAGPQVAAASMSGAEIAVRTLLGAAAWPGDPWEATFGAAPSSSTVELLVNADLEPDEDGDGYGDESQDGCPLSFAAQAPPCPSPDPPEDAQPVEDGGGEAEAEPADAVADAVVPVAAGTAAPVTVQRSRLRLYHLGRSRTVSRSGVFSFTIGCTGPIPCRGTLILRARSGAALVTTRVALRAGDRRRASIVLPRAVLRQIIRTGQLRARFTAAMRSSADGAAPGFSSRDIMLRPPGYPRRSSRQKARRRAATTQAV